MIDLTRVEHIKGVQSNLRTLFGSPHGIEVMKFLEQICGWYDFSETDPNSIMVSHGKRQVLATIKTLIDLSSEQVHALIKQREI